MTVTLEDIQKFMSSALEVLVTWQCRLDGWRDRVEDFLGRELPIAGPATWTSGVPISWLRQQFTHCSDGADIQTVTHWAWIPSLVWVRSLPRQQRWHLVFNFSVLHYHHRLNYISTVFHFHFIPISLHSTLCRWQHVLDVPPLLDRLGCGWGVQLGIRGAGFLVPLALQGVPTDFTVGSIGGYVCLLQVWMWFCIPIGRPTVLAPHRWFEVAKPRLGPTVPYFCDQVRVDFARPWRAYVEYGNELNIITTSMVSNLF